MRHKPGWIIAIMFFVALILAYGSLRANAQERIESAYISAPGFLVLNYNVDNIGVVSEAHQVLYAIKRPITCEVSADYPARYLIFTNDALVIDREPMPSRRKVCTDYNFITRKCRKKK